MQIYGYHRTSTKEQHLDRGIQEIERYCNEHEMALTNIFTDQETGKNFNRPRYTVLVEDVLRPGDILIVTELDRLGRNKYDTMQQIQRIKNMGVRLMVLELPTTLKAFWNGYVYQPYLLRTAWWETADKKCSRWRCGS